MATIIDSLIVELGLDAKQLEAKAPASVNALKKLESQGDKTEKQVGKISKTSKETSRSVEGLTKAVGGFLAVIGGTMAIKAFVSDFITANAQLDRFSKNIGIGVSTISAWSNASEKLGGSAQGLQGTFDMLSKSQTQLMLTGESGLIPYMSALGISLADVNGKARPVTEILLDLADKFSHMDRTTANNLGRMMGIDQGTMNLLLQGRKELELEISRQKEQTAVTKAQADQAQKFQTQIAGVKQQFQALGRSLLMDTAPTLEKIFNALMRFGEWAQQNKEVIEDFLTIMATGLAAIALASSPISLTVAAIVALGAAIALLWQDYQTWKRGGDSLIDWGKWEPAITLATKGITALGNAIAALVGWYDKWAIKSGNFGAGLDVIKKALGIKTDEGTNAATSSAPGRGNSRLDPQTIKKFFMSKGRTDAEAAGITSNLISESFGRADAVGDKGTAYGLAQWHPDRQAAFKQWAGKDIRQSSPQEQLEFVDYEMRKMGITFPAGASASEAGAIVSKNYERPRDVAGEASRRGTYAATLAGIPGAASTAARAPQGGGGSQSSVDRSVKTDIGEITINTQATDVSGIKDDLEHGLDYLFVSQANSGLY